MEIRWLEDYNVEIVDSFDEQQDEVNEMHIARFNKGDINDVDIIEDRKYTVDMKFSDGSMGFSVNKKWFEKVN